MNPISRSLSRLSDCLRLALVVAGAGGILIFSGCGTKEQAEAAAKAAPKPEEIIAQTPEVRGVEVKSVELTKPLKPEWVAAGRSIYDGKCLACHKLTGDRVVGPGWAGVTKKRQPVWIMNMITNVDVMLEKDAEAQKLLEQCLIRMPNQNVTVEDARKIFEFMRHNDGES